MKAMVIDEFGGPQVFREAKMPTPEPTPGHLLVKVAATSVNPVDFKIRSGAIPAIAPAFPAVLHGDVAGVVEAVGEGVEGFNAGDEVYACAGGFKGLAGGALAEHMLADAEVVASKPKSISMIEAAALPLVTITAWEAIMERVNVQPGQHVLVHGATGGTGHIGIQLAKVAGATVYATGSSLHKLEVARKLGADVAINYREQSVEQYVDEYTDGQGFDVVFDSVGDQVLADSLTAATRGGKVVSIATRSIQDLTPLHSKGLTLHGVFMILPLLIGKGKARHGQILRKAAALVEEGRLRPLVDESCFHVTEVAKAHARLEAGEAVGKIVLRW